MEASERDVTDPDSDMDKLSKDIRKILVDFSFNSIPGKGLYQEEESNKTFPDTITMLVFAPLRLTSPKP